MQSSFDRSIRKDAMWDAEQVRKVIGHKSGAKMRQIVALCGQFTKVKGFKDIADALLRSEEGLTLEIAETFLPWVRKVCGKNVPAGEELRVLVKDGVNLWLLLRRNGERKIARHGVMTKSVPHNGQ